MHKTETTLPLDGRDRRSRVWWGFKKSRAGIAFWPPPHNSCRSGKPCQSSRGTRSIGRCGGHGRSATRHLSTPGQSTPCVTAIFARAAPPFRFHPCGILWSTRARSWHTHVLRLSPLGMRVCTCVLACIGGSLTMPLTLVDFADARYKCLSQCSMN